MAMLLMPQEGNLMGMLTFIGVLSNFELKI